MKVSFDFDGTLDREDVQSFAKSLIEKGYEVWIITARPDIFVGADGMTVQPDNKDLYDVAKSLGIQPQHVMFMCYELKETFIRGNGFSFHLDDDDIELAVITRDTDECVAVDVKQSNWRSVCEKILKQNEVT